MKTAIYHFLIATCYFAAAPVRILAAPQDIKGKIDAILSPAFDSAVTSFPCKIGTTGKPKIGKWQEVDECLSKAVSKIDWKVLTLKLKELRDGTRGISAPEFDSTVAGVLALHVLPFDKVFLFKDPKTLLPLTNSVLRFLPSDSMKDAPVYEKTGTLLGSFTGVYTYERSGGSGTGSRYRLSLFEYSDRNGESRSVSDRLLLDSYGIPWKEAAGQLGFRLSADQLDLNGKE
jgi:hypothetical protein